VFNSGLSKGVDPGAFEFPGAPFLAEPVVCYPNMNGRLVCAFTGFQATYAFPVDPRRGQCSGVNSEQQYTILLDETVASTDISIPCL
jgi:hypothetical protein